MKRAAVLIATAICLQAQATRDLRLPQAVHLRGTVVDSQGRPVVGASIDHTADYQHTYHSDSDGRFELDTSAPSIVIRKAGFQARFVRTQGEGELRIVLKDAGAGRSFPFCKTTRGRYGLHEFWAWFQFPRMPGVSAGREISGDDYLTRIYYAGARKDGNGIRHGSGSHWGSGMPLDEEVWQSVAYEEQDFNAGDFVVRDARGQTAEGKRWRNLGKLAESATYFGVDSAAAVILDRVLDGACLAEPARPRRR